MRDACIVSFISQSVHGSRAQTNKSPFIFISQSAREQSAKKNKSPLPTKQPQDERDDAGGSAAAHEDDPEAPTVKRCRRCSFGDVADAGEVVVSPPRSAPAVRKPGVATVDDAFVLSTPSM
jgi:hypothetical protein